MPDDPHDLQQTIDDAAILPDQTARLGFLRDMLADWFDTAPDEPAHPKAPPARAARPDLRGCRVPRRDGVTR